MSLVGTGEEALFRGVIYEEIKARTTARTTKIADLMLFPLGNLPGDICAGYSASMVIFQLFWRAGMTLVFDATYDQGGFPCRWRCTCGPMCCSTRAVAGLLWGSRV